MSQFIEFVGNNLLLFVSLLVVLGMIAYMEYQRFFSGTTHISVPDALRLQNDEDALFIDVREVNEFKSGHILDAKNHPMSNFEKNLGQLDKHKNTPLVVYCATGSRSSRACTKLRKREFASVYNLSGGVTAWEKASLPLVTK
ncbi:MAG TPA: rhodanese-like domain-containing protein [Gammaproteobacteria bacterium]|jgi:rhodanese-related sulfurtransferase|nr:rhodanese-like domain-containing protein [Gammaproteobacteria bacterium]